VKRLCKSALVLTSNIVRSFSCIFYGILLEKTRTGLSIGASLARIYDRAPRWHRTRNL